MDNVKKENKQDNLEFIKKLAEINNRNAVGGLLINIRKSRQLLEPIILQVKSKIQKIKQDKANAKVNGDNVAETNKIVEIKAEKAKESEIVVNEEPKQVKQEENTFVIYTEPSNVLDVAKALEEQGYKVLSSQVERVPQNLIELDESKIENFEKLLDKLDDNDDIQEYFHNVMLLLEFL